MVIRTGTSAQALVFTASIMYLRGYQSMMMHNGTEVKESCMYTRAWNGYTMALSCNSIPTKILKQGYLPRWYQA